MMRRFLGIAAAVVGLVVSVAAAQEPVVLTLGEPVMVTVTEVAPNGLVTVNFVLDEPTYISIAVRTQDETDPAFRLSDEYGRELVTIGDNVSSPLALSQLDAVYDNTLLLAGAYRLEVARLDADLVGSGELEVLVVEGTPPDLLGMGATALYTLNLAPNEVVRIPVPLQRGDVVSIAAVSLNPDMDLRLVLRDPVGLSVVANEDNETPDLFVGIADPRIYQFTAPETETYTLLIRPFGTESSGELLLFTQRHGRITGEATSEFLTGSALNRQRTILNADFEAGEVIRLTARAIDSALDPELTLLDPNAIIIAYNDDHTSDATDLEMLDARIQRLFLSESGTYEINVTSISGAGPYEVEVERFGRFEPLDEPLTLDLSLAMRAPLSEPTISPEATPEVTAEPTN